MDRNNSDIQQPFGVLGGSPVEIPTAALHLNLERVVEADGALSRRDHGRNGDNEEDLKYGGSTDTNRIDHS